MYSISWQKVSSYGHLHNVFYNDKFQNGGDFRPHFETIY